MAHTLSKPLSTHIVNEYPKSGGTWIAQMLSSALNVPFARHGLPVARSSIMNAHCYNSWGMRLPLVVWRDGRDIMVSWYYHCFFLNNFKNNKQIVVRCRQDVSFSDYNNIHDNMPEFIEYVFTRPHYPKFSWNDFVNRWYGISDVVYTRYEDMSRDTPGELLRVVYDMTRRDLPLDRAKEIAKSFSFARQSGRQPGQEDKSNFMRKGVIGDWRNCFNRESREIFHYYAGDAMSMLGYEIDGSWVNTV